MWILSQGLSALIGASIVYIFGVRRVALEARSSFLQRQLEEFYSPMAGYRRRIWLKSELREEIACAASAAWQDVAKRLTRSPGDHEAREKAYEPYGRIIEYDNRQLAEEFMPLYRKMLDLFSEKYWLADEDTRKYYEELVRYVEIWDRFLARSIPSGVLERIPHGEDRLQPFYEHVEKRLATLRSEIREPSFWRLRL